MRFLTRASTSILLSSGHDSRLVHRVPHGGLFMIRIIVIAGAGLMLWSPNVTAQEALAVKPCIADAKSLCPGMTGAGIEPLRGCLRDHLKEISDACILSLAKLDE